MVLLCLEHCLLFTVISSITHMSYHALPSSSNTSFSVSRLRNVMAGFRLPSHDPGRSRLWNSCPWQLPCRDWEVETGLALHSLETARLSVACRTPGKEASRVRNGPDRQRSFTQPLQNHMDRKVCCSRNFGTSTTRFPNAKAHIQSCWSPTFKNKLNPLFLGDLFLLNYCFTTPSTTFSNFT